MKWFVIGCLISVVGCASGQMPKPNTNWVEAIDAKTGELEYMCLSTNELVDLVLWLKAKESAN